MIGNLRLWQVLAMWWLQRRQRVPVTFWNYPVMLRQISDNRNVLPVPRGRLATWLTTRVLLALDAERDRVMVLRLAGVFASGVLTKD